VLDADVTVTQDAPGAVKLRLDGSYRPPLGPVGAGLDRAVMNRAANATIRAFITSLSDALAHPAAELGRGSEQPDSRWLPGPEVS
jgi:hypothetical protein